MRVEIYSFLTLNEKVKVGKVSKTERENLMQTGKHRIFILEMEINTDFEFVIKLAESVKLSAKCNNDELIEKIEVPIYLDAKYDQRDMERIALNFPNKKFTVEDQMVFGYQDNKLQ